MEEEDMSPTENAAALAEKKLKILLKRNYDKHELSSKLYTYLYSKGYDYDTIKEVLLRLVNEEDFI